MRRASSDKPFTLRKAIELTEDIGRICDRLPEQERDVLGSEMSRYAYLVVGRLSTALDATTAARRYRSYSAARGAVTALASLLDIATRVRAITSQDVERSMITCDELAHMLKDLAGTPDW